LLGDDVLMTTGRSGGLVLFSNIVFAAAIVTVLLKAAIET
jgi:hypothetical protein